MVRKEMVKTKDMEVGHCIQIYCPKNQAGTPHRKMEIGLIWGVGFDNYKALLDMAVFVDIIKVGAAGWHTMPDGTKVQGATACQELLASDLDLYASIYKSVKEELGI
jgi:hypothetical protein